MSVAAGAELKDFEAMTDFLAIVLAHAAALLVERLVGYLARTVFVVSLRA